MVSRTEKLFRIGYFLLILILPLVGNAYFTTPTYIFEHAAFQKNQVKTLKARYKINFSDNDDFCYQNLYYSKPSTYKAEIECKGEKASLTSNDMAFSMWNLLFSSSKERVLEDLKQKNIVDMLYGTMPLPLFKKDKFLLRKKIDAQSSSEDEFKPETVVYVDSIEYKKFSVAEAHVLPVRVDKSFFLKVFASQDSNAYIYMDNVSKKERPYSTPQVLRWSHNNDTYEIRFKDYKLYETVFRAPETVSVFKVSGEEVSELLAEFKLQQLTLNPRLPDDTFTIKESDTISHSDMARVVDICYH